MERNLVSLQKMALDTRVRSAIEADGSLSQNDNGHRGLRRLGSACRSGWAPATTLDSLRYALRRQSLSPS
jgi:hypothetical protein